MKIIDMKTGKKVGFTVIGRRWNGQLLSVLVLLLCSSVAMRLTSSSLVQVGAAFGPLLQDLREFLEENQDYAVAPDWAETVRSSVSTAFIYCFSPIGWIYHQTKLPPASLSRASSPRASSTGS